jgi:uncharacterized protein (TIGR03435 family)
MRSLLAIVPVVLGLINAPQSRAQSSTPAFEVASIKLNRTGDGSWGFNDAQGGRFVAKNIPVKELLKEAYRVKDSQLLGAPSWISSEHYDIQAKMDESAVAAMRTMDQDQKRKQISLLLQALLLERFKLTLRRETRELPVYVLVVAKNGPKFKETTLTPAELAPPDPQRPPGQHPRGRMAQMMRGKLVMTGVPLDVFAEMLTRQVGRVVLNQTGLNANYDLEMHWTPDEGQSPAFRGAGDAAPIEAAALPDATGPTFFTALQEQLGLKLEAQKSPLDVLVIDHIERPSEN